MIIADFECPKCGHIHEDIIDSSVWEGTCPECGEKTKRIMTLGGVNCANEDARHIRDSAATLLDMETARHSDKPHVRDLAENPTRSSLNRYLKVEGIRYVENERGAPPVFQRQKPIDRERMRREIYDTYRKSKSITIETSRH